MWSNPGGFLGTHAHLPSAAPQFHAGPQEAPAVWVPPWVTGQDAVHPRLFVWIPRPRAMGCESFWEVAICPGSTTFGLRLAPAALDTYMFPGSHIQLPPSVLPATAVSRPSGGSEPLPGGCLRGHGPESLPLSASSLTEHRSWLQTPLLDGPCLREGSRGSGR